MTENPLAKYRRKVYDKSAPYNRMPSEKPTPLPGFLATFPVETPEGVYLVTLEGPAPKTMEQFDAISDLWCRRWGIPPMIEKAAEPYRGRDC